MSQNDIVDATCRAVEERNGKRLLEIIDNKFKMLSEMFNNLGTVEDIGKKLVKRTQVSDKKSTNDAVEKLDVQIMELDKTLEGQHSKAAALKKQNLETLGEVQKVKRELIQAKEQLAELKHQEELLQRECNNLEASCLPCEEDQKRITKYKTAHLLFKESTGIRWDYSVPDNVVKGYVKNKTTNYLKAFNVTQSDPTTVSDKIWALIGDGAHPDWKRLATSPERDTEEH